MSVASNTVPAVPGYDLLKLIGTGAYGDVYLARSLSGSYCALKIAYRDRASDTESFEREFRGVSAFRRIPHRDGLIRIFSVGRDDAQGIFYADMELADDERPGGRIDPETYRPATLAGLLAAQVALPLKDCLEIAIDLAGAVRHLQEHHLAHRDIKPGNVLMIRGRPVLADVGLVADMRDIKSVVGTQGYTPPENHGTPGGDVYSLGRLLYSASTGRGVGEFGYAPREEADTGSPLFANWLAIVGRACAERPSERYASAKAMLADLTALRRKTRRPGCRGCLFWALALTVLTLGLFLALFLNAAFPDSPDTEPRQRPLQEEVPPWLDASEAAHSAAGPVRLHVNPVLLTDPPDAKKLSALPSLLKTAPYPVSETGDPSEFIITPENITKEMSGFLSSTNRLDPGPGYLEREKRRGLGTGDFAAWFDRWGFLEGGHYSKDWDPKNDRPLDVAGHWVIGEAEGSIPKDCVGLDLVLTGDRYSIRAGGREIEAGAFSTSSARSAAAFSPDSTKLKIAFFCWRDTGDTLVLQGYTGRLKLRRTGSDRTDTQ